MNHMNLKYIVINESYTINMLKINSYMFYIDDKPAGWINDDFYSIVFWSIEKVILENSESGIKIEKFQ